MDCPNCYDNGLDIEMNLVESIIGDKSYGYDTLQCPECKYSIENEPAECESYDD